MPNWCQGVLKVRGKKKDLINFLLNGIERLRYVPNKNLGLEIKEISLDLKINEDEYKLEKQKGWLHIKNTRRCFLDYLEWWLIDAESDEDVITQYIDVKQAWRLEPDEFTEIAKKFNLDFKIKGYESGMEFSQEFEILNGTLTNYEEATYTDWEWDVDDPRLGG